MYVILWGNDLHTSFTEAIFSTLEFLFLPAQITKLVSGIVLLIRSLMFLLDLCFPTSQGVCFKKGLMSCAENKTVSPIAFLYSLL